MEEYERIGTVTHYFDRIGVAVVLLENELFIDDWILFYGPHTDVEQQVVSMQINHEAIDRAVAGEEIAIKVNDAVREGDDVFLILDEPS